MITSHLYSPSVWRTKPVTCGKVGVGHALPELSGQELRELLLVAFFAPRSRTACCEDRRRRGTLSGRRARSPRRALAAACAAIGAVAANADGEREDRDQLPMHSRFRLRVGLRLCRLLGGAPAREIALGARAEVDVEVVDVAHDVQVRAERRHDVLLAGAGVLPAARDDVEEIGVVHAASWNRPEPARSSSPFRPGRGTRGSRHDSGGSRNRRTNRPSRPGRS